jgi:hypothetical protein
MTNETDKRDGLDPVRAKDSRQDRLKLALRENLKRRKSQAKERDKTSGDPSQEREAVRHQDVAKKLVK